MLELTQFNQNGGVYEMAWPLLTLFMPCGSNPLLSNHMYLTVLPSDSFLMASLLFSSLYNFLNVKRWPLHYLAWNFLSSKDWRFIIIFFYFKKLLQHQKSEWRKYFFKCRNKSWNIYMCAYLSTYECFSSLVLWYFKIKEYIKTETEGLKFSLSVRTLG